MRNDPARAGGPSARSADAGSAAIAFACVSAGAADATDRPERLVFRFLAMMRPAQELTTHVHALQDALCSRERRSRVACR